MGIVKRGKWKRILLRAVLTALCLLVFVWIFSNSLQTGEQSSQKSHEVTDRVQAAVGVVAPQSPIATATGKDYDKLHNAIRTLAHFSEFTLLGALLAWCYVSYTDKKRFFVLPVGLVLLTPLVDEYIQMFSSGRGSELFDVWVDTAGGLCGIVFALLTVVVGIAIRRRRRRKRAKTGSV